MLALLQRQHASVLFAFNFSFTRRSRQGEKRFSGVRDRNIMFLMERFNVICWGSYFLHLCVRTTECPEGSTEKYHILVSFSINFMALSFIFTAPSEKDGEYVEIHSNNTLCSDWNVSDHITVQNAYRSDPSPPWRLLSPPGHPSLPPSPLHFSVLCSTPSCGLLPLSPSIAPSAHAFYLIPHSVSLRLYSHSISFSWLTLVSFSSIISLSSSFCSLSHSSSVSILDHKELSAGRINKPSVAYWEPVIAALHRRLIPPVLAPSSFYSFLLFVLHLTSFVLSWHEVWLSAGRLHVQPE